MRPTGEIRLQSEMVSLDGPTFPASIPKKWWHLITVSTRQYFKIGWSEEKWEAKRPRIKVCYDECGKEVSRNWAPADILGWGWRKIEGSEFLADHNYQPDYVVDFPSIGVPGF